MKKFICCLLLVGLAVAASAAQAIEPLATPQPPERKAGVWRYWIEEGGVTITGYDGSGKLVEIPETLEVVLTPEQALELYKQAAEDPLLRVQLALSDPSFGNIALSGEEEISLALPVNRIGAEAFKGNKKVESVFVPNCVKEIGESAFADCTWLSEIRLPEQLKRIENRVFSACRSLAEIEIPNTVELIGFAAFERCSKLSSVKIPARVTTIRSRAFYKCTALAQIDVPPQLDWIGTHVFDETPWLLNNKETFVVIGRGLLIRYNGKEQTVRIPSSVRVIVDAFRDNKTLRSVYMTDSVERIGYYAFSGCSQLLGVSMSHALTEIQDYAFDGCVKLVELELSEGLTSVGAYAMNGCRMLAALELPATVAEIGDHAFSGCAKLTEITVPLGVTALQEGVFYGCRALKKATIPATVLNIAADAFRQCSDVTLYVDQNSVAEAYAREKRIPYELTYAAAVQEQEEAETDDPAGYRFELRGGRVTLAGYLEKKSAAVIPAMCDLGAVTVIGTGAFAGNGDVMNVVIPTGCEVIEDGAFSAMGQQVSVVVPETVTSIGERAFAGSQVVLIGAKGSFAQQYALRSGLVFLEQQ